MIESLYIENFRGFERLAVEGLTKFNLIIGRNSVGKTALMEALMAGGTDNPSLLLNLATARGIAAASWANLDAAEIWGDLFGDRRRTLTIRSISGPNSDVIATGRFQDADVHILAGGGFEGVPGADSVDVAALTNARPVELAWSVSRNGNLVADARGQGTQLGAATRQLLQQQRADRLGMLIGMRGALTADNLRTFTQLKEAGKLQPIVDAVRVLAPELVDFEIAAYGTGHVLKGILNGGIYRPVGLLGEGVVRCLMVLLSSAQIEKGLICIDDIDAGLHHSVLTNCLAALRRFVAGKDVQVFATTHSYECIEAAHRAFADTADDLAVYRLDRDADGIRATRYDGETRAYAIKRGWEVR